MTRPYIVAVTGGIGSGKSTVCAAFARRGVPVIDADLVAREVVTPGSEGLREVVAAFGAEVLNADGGLDRALLRQLVFQDDQKRKRLEGILHPLIRGGILAKIHALRANYCLLAIPLLVEKSGYDFIDRILVVDCPVEAQLQRVIERDKLTAAEVQAIMATQASRETRLRYADDVIVNAGGVAELESQVDTLHQQYLSLADLNKEDPQ